MNKLSTYDFKDKKVHMIGIGGSSMSGLAKMLLDLGAKVSGSDNTTSKAILELKKLNMDIFLDHKEENIIGKDIIIFSAAIDHDNPEIKKAIELGIPTIERAILLGYLMTKYEKSIAVSGTHGKTTVTGMASKILFDSHLKPTIHLGGELDFLGGNTLIGEKSLFLVEACEFNGSFLHLKPNLAVVLNIEEDHLDFYKDINHIEDAFLSFLSQIQKNGHIIGNGDNARTLAIMKKNNKNFTTFGFQKTNDWYADNLSYDSKGQGSFKLMYQGSLQGQVSLKVPGFFNVLNALAALAIAFYAGANMKNACESLSSFKGVRRRFEKTAIIDGVALYHDYGHNPREMKNIVQVAKMQPYKRVWAVMQPHTFSRVKRLFDDYLTCTKEADFTLVTDIFGAREADPGDIDSSMLVEGMVEKGVNAILTPSFDDVEKHLREHWKPGDMIITMGCGNINLLNDQIFINGNTKK